MAQDGIFGSERFIETVISGDASAELVGLKSALLNKFPQKTSALKVTAWWPYQAQTNFPEQFPTVALFYVQPSRQVNFFHRNLHPTTVNTLAWASQRTIQINIFGRTRPEMSEIQDACVEHIPVQAYWMWEKYRVQYGPTEDSGQTEKNPVLNAFFTFFRFPVTMPSAVSLT